MLSEVELVPLEGADSLSKLLVELAWKDMLIKIVPSCLYVMLISIVPFEGNASGIVFVLFSDYVCLPDPVSSFVLFWPV